MVSWYRSDYYEYGSEAVFWGTSHRYMSYMYYSIIIIMQIFFPFSLSVPIISTKYFCHYYHWYLEISIFHLTNILLQPCFYPLIFCGFKFQFYNKQTRSYWCKQIRYLVISGNSGSEHERYGNLMVPDMICLLPYTVLPWVGNLTTISISIIYVFIHKTYLWTQCLVTLWDTYSSYANFVVRTQAIKSMKSILSLVICGFSFLGIQVPEVVVVQEVVDLVPEVDMDLVVGGDLHSPVRIYAHRKRGWSVLWAWMFAGHFTTQTLNFILLLMATFLV